MKIYVETEDKYVLLTEENDYSNLENDFIKTELINEAMNRLETKKLGMEIEKQLKGGYKVKKLSVHPSADRANH